MRTPTVNDLTRRGVLASGLALAALRPAFALTNAEASDLIGTVVGQITAIINSGKSQSAMFGDFERLFNRYGDVPTIARFTLGPPARTATPAQMRAYTDAFGGYMARKYGQRFREFIGGTVTVTGTRDIKNGYDVVTVANLRGQAPFEVVFRVSDRSGRPLFYDLVVEGISLLKAEQSEIGAMLDQNRGSIDGLIAQLNRT